MNKANLDDFQRNLRMNIRNFFLIANLEELEKSRENYPDKFSKECIDELIEEWKAENDTVR